MKKTYNTPKLSVHGSVEQLTHKQFGTDDGLSVTIPVPGGSVDVPIGS